MARLAPVTLVEQADGFGAGFHGGRLAAIPGMPEHRRAGLPGGARRAVPRAIVHDHDNIDAGQRRRGRDGGADAIRLVIRRHDDGHLCHDTRC
jgi:hypothetical protein